MELLITIITIIGSFATGGGLAGFFVLRFTRQKAAADAKNSELENVQEAVKIWRETAEALREENKATNENLSNQVEALRKEVCRLTRIQSKIVVLLDKITPENMEKMVEHIKNELNESHSIDSANATSGSVQNG